MKHSSCVASSPRQFPYCVAPLSRRLSFLLTLVLLSCIVAGTLHYFIASQVVYAASNATAVTTFHNDLFRTGQNNNETLLNTRNVNVKQFGKRVSYHVDGQIYAQPLFVPNVYTASGIRNVVYVATENDSVYAFDADARRGGTPLWQARFIDPAHGITTVPAKEVFTKYSQQDISPHVGITGTPVIDIGTRTLYVVSMTKEHGRYVQRLHALDLGRGYEKSNVIIQVTISGTGDGSSHGRLSFDARTEDQRPGLLLYGGIVYISWGSFGDSDPYHGWLLGYGAATLRLLRIYIDTPNGGEGGIWMSGAAPSVDANGNMYIISGNGSFDLNRGGPNASDSFIRLSTQYSLARTDYFSPFNQTCISGRDADLGSGGPLLLPDQPGTHPHLMVSVGKEGRVYVVNRDNMGKFTADKKLQCGTKEENRTDIDKIVQELPTGTTGSLFGIAGYWSGTATSGSFVYFGGFDATLQAFQMKRGVLATKPSSRTPETFGFTGATPSISSNHNVAGTGIVWVNSPSSCSGPGCYPRGIGALRAYDATNVGRELYNSEQNAKRDRVDSYVKFTLPTVANGEVFVGTQMSLLIYGEL